MAGPDSAALLAQMMDLHPSAIDLSLGRTYRLLEGLGRPQDRLPPVIHIAGTNGKGSTQAMLRAGFSGVGQRVHAYTSPHLVRFNERIVLAGEDITEAGLRDILARTLEANAGAPVTFFEATTCAAFLAFSETPADVLLLEVGMGGRMDTTNVVDAPDLTIITPVALDHQAFLGESIAEIAAEKAGILKRGVPCVVGRQTDEALEVIEARAARLGVPLLAHGQHWHVWEERGRLVFQDETGLLDLPRPALVGPHQVENAGMVLAALRYLGHGEATCEAAMTGATWPARMQRLRSGPLVEAAPGWEIWLDGGHNRHAGTALAESLASLPDRPTSLVLGMLRSREPDDYLAPLTPRVEAIQTVHIPDEDASWDAEALADAITLDVPVAAAVNPAEAIRRIVGSKDAGRIVICGSLYLAGAILKDHG
ncbi:dihydrofolate synthase/folylpolyglutamate synthase [Aliiruegeria haliotis]|uniref:Dihydrofolate synthase/folylpolyglutamate synthase n=1 Tax=Aliiruegeria haliotis TaxID=1280846 RepID=A0A2T0RSQ7_9RHOB|nr:folylpolyglutamate synthase/dihydrofolate synthase family protein [Aliiruegeria haliotis]PRY24157.1 dihydrofolate synthase/folylpolyglutamate synthase [Aliiruegeria haliotis]